MLLRASRLLSPALGLALASLLVAAPAAAHVALLPVEGNKLEIKTDDAKPKKNKFSFKTDKHQEDLMVAHDPSAEGFRLLRVRGFGPPIRDTLL